MEETIAGLPVVMLIGLFWLACADKQCGNPPGNDDPDGYDNTDDDV